MGIEFASSADKHEIPRGDALWAATHAVFMTTKVKSAPGQPAFPRRAFVGPAHAQTDRLLEVLVEIRPDGNLWVYHVMVLGSLYRKLMEEES